MLTLDDIFETVNLLKDESKINFFKTEEEVVGMVQLGIFGDDSDAVMTFISVPENVETSDKAFTIFEYINNKDGKVVNTKRWDTLVTMNELQSMLETFIGVGGKAVLEHFKQ